MDSLLANFVTSPSSPDRLQAELFKDNRIVCEAEAISGLEGLLVEGVWLMLVEGVGLKLSGVPGR